MQYKCSQINALTALAMIAAIAFSTAGNAALASYSQDFDGLNIADATALGDDGWLVFASVFDTDKTSHLYDYGPEPAPNGGAGFSDIVSGQGGPAQGSQQLSVFSDYNNLDHAVGKWIEAIVFQELTISATDAGSVLTFDFDGKHGSLAGSSSAQAFIKTLDPDAGFATTNNVVLDTTVLGSEWGEYTLQLLIPADNSLDGQTLQFGFSSFASNYEASGNYYDNINASVSAVPVPAAIWLFMSGSAFMFGLVRRKR